MYELAQGNCRSGACPQVLQLDSQVLFVMSKSRSSKTSKSSTKLSISSIEKQNRGKRLVLRPGPQLNLHAAWFRLILTPSAGLTQGKCEV